jgi:hypothetical protein
MAHKTIVFTFESKEHLEQLLDIYRRVYISGRDYRGGMALVLHFVHGWHWSEAVHQAIEYDQDRERENLIRKYV